MSSINFGGFNSSSNTISGLVSGLRTDAIIQAAVAGKSKPIGDLIVQQSSNSGQIAALKSLKGILKNLKSLADGLRTPPGVANEDKSAFLYRTARVTGNPTGFDNASEMVTVTASAGAQEANYTIEITQLARKEIEVIEGFGSLTADLTDGGTPEVAAGTFQINGEDIVIPSGASLVDIRAAINAMSNETGVTASIVTITPESAEGADDGVYQLQLVSNNTGAANSISFTNFTTVFPALGGVTVTETQDARDAEIEFNGTTINRTSNTFDDLIDNVTIELLNQEPNTVLNVAVTKDSSVATTQVQNFIAGINQLFIFSSNQQARDPVTGEPLSTALLPDSPMLKNLISTVQGELKRTIGGVSGNFNSLSDLGFEFELFEGEEIEGNPDTPLTALLTDRGLINSIMTNSFESVREVFEAQFNAAGANHIMALSSTTNSLSLSNFTITVDVNQPAGQRVLINPGGGNPTFYAEFTPYDSNDLTAGGTITGADGTAIEGLKIVYTGDGTDGPIDITVSQGLGERLYNEIDEYTKFLGTIDKQILLLQDKNDDIEREVAAMKADVEDFKANLTNQFAGLEAKISQANSILGFLNAVAQAQNK